MGKIGKVLAGVGAVVVIAGIGAACNGGGDDMQKTDPPAASVAKGDDKSDSSSDKSHSKEPVSQATTFRNCVAKNGTPEEKSAVQHVTKVTGTDKRNDIADIAEVYTDFTGGFGSSDTGKANLIASAFVSCYDSNNGLVEVYGSDGNVITTKNF